ncbi:MAG: DEAD/DEAH box helicase [Synergistaceae bacterium]
MEPIVPRDYQAAATKSIWDYFINGNTGNPVVAMPTGVGKSIVIGDFLRGACQTYPSTKALMLTHVKELILQNAKAVRRMWPEVQLGINSAGIGRREFRQQIVCGGIASVRNSARAFGRVDLVLIDECHLVSPNGNTMYMRFLQDLKDVNPHVKVIGFSATPYRLKQGYVTDGGIFTDVCFDNTRLDDFNTLIAQGYLAPLIPKATDLELDLTDVKIQAGEYNQGQLQDTVDKEAITEAALDELCDAGRDRKSWMIFGSGVQHIEHIVDSLDRRNIDVAAVHSKMPSKQRDEAIAAFKKGEIRCIVNMGVLTTGFDHPPLDLIGMLRPTQSPGLWVQMLGRGTRPAEGKNNCLVLDFAGNTARLGPINDPVIPKKPGAGGGGEAPVKLCPQCNTYHHTAVRVCDYELPDGSLCGYVFPIQSKLQANASNKELIKKSYPIVEDFRVDKLVYNVHQKAGRPDALKIKYYCGYRFFTYYLCFEHGGYAAKKSRDWWRNMLQDRNAATPSSTQEAIALIEQLPVARWIRVHTNKTYPEILQFTFNPEGFSHPPVSYT